MASTFKGQPVFNERHAKGLSPEDLIASYKSGKIKADGTVGRVYYNSETGWYDAEIQVWDEDTANNIDSGEWFPSCAYLGNYSGTGGKHNLIPYQNELKSGTYTHLAVVKVPRYDGAKFCEKGEINVMSKFTNWLKEVFNSAPDDVKNELAEEVKKDKEADGKKEAENDGGISPDATIEYADGKKVSIKELLDAFKASQKSAPAENEVSIDDEIDIDGKKVSIKELLAIYEKSKEATNAGDGAETDKKEKDKKEEVTNAAPPESAATEKEVSLKLKKAIEVNNSGAPDPIAIETIDDRQKAVRERYSFDYKKEAK